MEADASQIDDLKRNIAFKKFVEILIVSRKEDSSKLWALFAELPDDGQVVPMANRIAIPIRGILVVTTIMNANSLPR